MPGIKRITSTPSRGREEPERETRDTRDTRDTRSTNRSDDRGSRDDRGSSRSDDRGGRAPPEPFYVKEGKNGEYGRLGAKLDGQRGGVTVFFFPTEDAGVLNASMTSWSPEGSIKSLKVNMDTEKDIEVGNDGTIVLRPYIKLAPGSKYADAFADWASKVPARARSSGGRR